MPRRPELARLLPASLVGRVFALQIAVLAGALCIAAACALEWGERSRDLARAAAAGRALHDAAMQTLAGRPPAGALGDSGVEVAPAGATPSVALKTALHLPLPPRDERGLADEVTLWLPSGGLGTRRTERLAQQPSAAAYFAQLAHDLVELGRPGELEVAVVGGTRLHFVSPSLWRERLSVPGLVLAGLFALALLLVLAAMSAQALSRPFHELAATIEERGEDVQMPVLAEAGPVEARAMVRADNRLRQRIAAMLADQTRMLAAVSHDLRTPSTRLRLRAEFVREPEVREAMLRDLDEMDAMLTEVLEFLSHEVREEPVKAVDLGALLQSVCDDYADVGRPVSFREPPPLTFHGVPTLFAVTPAAGTHVFQHERKLRQACRPNALRRAICNLIDNALKYGHRADVRLDASGATVRIEVDDTGPGIPEAEMDKVFLPLYRLESSRRRSTGGIGLGLAVVKSVVAAHHGRVELRNRPEGGLNVSVELPRATA